MIVTTTSYIEGKKVEEYKGIVFGEVITGVNVLKDFAAGMRTFSAADPSLMKMS